LTRVTAAQAVESEEIRFDNSIKNPAAAQAVANAL
jgi:hypothetical protein